MNHKEFISELQKTCHMDHHQCATLLSALQKLMVQAAIDQIPVTLHGLGTFTSHKHPEFIQEDEHTGEQTLFPPRISYRMQAMSTSQQNADSDQGVASELSEYAQMPYETVAAFLQALAHVVVSYVENHEEVEVHGMGTFHRVEAHQAELQRIAFTCDEQMKEQVNAPFSCFEPVVIREGRKPEVATAFVQMPEMTADSPAERVEDAAEAMVEPAERTDDAAEAPAEPADSTDDTAEAPGEPVDSSDVVAEAPGEPAESTDDAAEVAGEPAESADDAVVVTGVPADSAAVCDALSNNIDEPVAEPVVLIPSVSEADPQEAAPEPKEEIAEPQAVAAEPEEKIAEPQAVAAETKDEATETREVANEKTDKEMGKEKSGHGVLYTVLAIVLAACLAFAIYLGVLFFGSEKYVEAELAEPEYVEEAVPAELAEAQLEESEEAPADEAQEEQESVQNDAPADPAPVVGQPEPTEQPKQVEQPKPAEQPAQAEKKPAETPKPAPKEQPKAKEFHRLMGADGQPVTVTLNPGERLTIVSLNQYGDKAFWPYIFDVNSDRIKAPNLVQAGMKLYLPDPAFYDINPNNEESLRKAKNRAAQLLK